MATITSHQGDLSSTMDLQIKVPANIYLLSNSQIAKTIAYLQQLVDLASTITDSLDQVQSAIRDLGCDCILARINAPIKAYTNNLKAMYPNHHFLTAHSAMQGTGLAVYIGAKVRLRRTLRIHVQLIEDDLFLHGEKIKIVDVFSPDAKALADLGSDVSTMIDRFLIAEGGLYGELIMSTSKIDMHAHCIPLVYRRALEENGYENPDGMPGIPEWTVARHLQFMHDVGISKSILSVSSPGVEVTEDAAQNADLTVACNNECAEIKKAYPDRFGYFASLPLFDIDRSITEIQRLDTVSIKPDGFILLTNARGHYLGDPYLRPVLTELNKRKALVFLHPTAPCNLCAWQETTMPYSERLKTSSPLASVYITPMFEFMTDSALSIIDLLLTGTTLRFPSVRWIIVHCGNFLPLALPRVFSYPKPFRDLAARDPWPGVTEETMRRTLKEQFWYDLAGKSLLDVSLEVMLKFTNKNRFVYGSDTPWTSWEKATLFAGQFEERLGGVVEEHNLEAIWEGTAKELLESVH